MFTKLFRIGNEPVIRYTNKGDAVLSLSLAYQYGRKGEDGKRPTQWIDASLWGKQAESLAPYLNKGSQIVATIDDLHIETYQGKNGEGHKLAGRVINLEFAGSKPEGQPVKQAMQAAAPSPRGGASGFDDMDSDIPF